MGHSFYDASMCLLLLVNVISLCLYCPAPDPNADFVYEITLLAHRYYDYGFGMPQQLQ